MARTERPISSTSERPGTTSGPDRIAALVDGYFSFARENRDIWTAIDLVKTDGFAANATK